MYHNFDLSALLPNPRMIVVDDDLGVAEMVADAIRTLNVNVQIAKDGLEALDLIYQFNPDVVLTDLKMPRMRGDDLLIELNRLGFAKPVIIMTGLDTADIAIRALRYRLFEIIEKPIVIDRLVATLKKAFETEFHRCLQQELFASAMKALSAASPTITPSEMMLRLERDARDALMKTRNQLAADS